MNENRMLQQVTAVFSTFMVFIYLGLGIFLIFFTDFSTLDKALRVIMGSTVIFYACYRAYRAYVKIVDAFFRNKSDSE